MRRSLITLILIGAVVFGIVQGCGEGEDRPYSLCPPSRSATKLTKPSQMGEEAASYRGPGPHRIYVDEYADPAMGTAGTVVEVEDQLPANWLLSSGDDGRYQLDALKLVACAYQYAVGGEGELGTCSYEDSSGDTYEYSTLPAKYDFRVYAAATGKVLSTFTVEGEDQGCPASRMVFPGRQGGNTDIAAEPDYGEVERRLKPLVERNVP
jgi:hypothetical protein